MDGEIPDEGGRSGSITDQRRLTNIVRTGFVAILILGIILISVTIYRLKGIIGLFHAGCHSATCSEHLYDVGN